ncbi:MAG: hypothetical protein QOH51_2027 [Acidobacteriota bacterium]|jgi:hypothetical protein|nr:hypothetical protein [Acidobacteriota bacterium]
MTLLVVILLFVGIMVVVVGVMFPGSKKKRAKPIPPEQRPANFQDRVVPGQGIIENIKTRVQVESDTKTQQVANLASQAATQGIEEQSRAIDAALRQSAIVDVHQRGSEKAEAEHGTELARLEAERLAYETNQQEDELKRLLIARAGQRGLSLESFNRVVEREELDNLDIRKLQKETLVRLEAGFIFQLREYHKLMMQRKELDGLYFEIDEIQNSNSSDYLKRMKIAEREADIKLLQEDRRARRQRLLQAFDGEDAEGSDGDSESGEHLEDTDA